MARSTPSTKGKYGSAKFRPRARIIQTLGRDLISNEVIAIQELIKNAYDADAKKVILTFEEPLTVGKGAIVITDDGDGMTLKTIKGAWMEPATISKVRKTVSRRGRRVTGEKGIGRFAAARVARVLEMTTVPKGLNQQLHVRFDWGAFEDQSRYLDQIRSHWRVERKPSGSHKGTSLRLAGLNDEWDEDEKRGITSFSELRSQLSRLVAPLGKDEFKITLELPERLSAYSGEIGPPAVLGKPQYKLSGSMDGRGVLTADYEGPGVSSLLLEANGTKPTVFGAKKIPSCGPFTFEFRVWDRDKEALEPLAKELGSTLRDIQRDLNAASGISVYRDRFRVLIPENDWLRLDLRRIQSPPMRLSNNQIVGHVFISADKNRGLKDQTNRQGIVDSLELEDFKGALKEILAKLEARRYAYRQSVKAPTMGPGIFQRLEFAPVRAYLLQRYPTDSELKDYLDSTDKTFREGIGEVQQVLSRYRRLATLGQLIDVVLHEGRTPVSTIKNQIELIAAEIKQGEHGHITPRVQARLSRIADQAEILNLLFKRLGPFSGRKRGRPIKTALEHVIHEAFGLHDKQIKELGVEVQMPNTTTLVTADPAEMQMIFVNLLDNSLYWLQRAPTNSRKIIVQIRQAPGEIQVVFSDNGPGVPPEYADQIFNPYFSTKPEGVGLGLTIAGETAAEYDGGLELIDKGPLPGATFRVVLHKRLGLEND